MKLEAWRKLFPARKAGPGRQNVRWGGRLVVLRSKRAEDAPSDHSWRRDPELAALDATAPLSLPFEQYKKFHSDDINFPPPWSVRLAIETLDGRHIGNCMYYDIDYGRRRAEIGIMIGDRSCWERGYGTDAILTLVRGIFHETDLVYLYLHTLLDNSRAKRAFEKGGFAPVRQVAREGYDFLLMEAHKGDWLRLHPEQDRASADPAEPAGPAE